MSIRSEIASQPIIGLPGERSLVSRASCLLASFERMLSIARTPWWPYLAMESTRSGTHLTDPSPEELPLEAIELVETELTLIP